MLTYEEIDARGKTRECTKDIQCYSEPKEQWSSLSWRGNGYSLTYRTRKPPGFFLGEPVKTESARAITEGKL